MAATELKEDTQNARRPRGSLTASRTHTQGWVVVPSYAACEKFIENLRKYKEPPLYFMDLWNNAPTNCTITYYNDLVLHQLSDYENGSIEWRGDVIDIDVPVLTEPFKDNPQLDAWHTQMEKCGCRDVKGDHFHSIDEFNTSAHVHTRCPVQAKSCIEKHALRNYSA